MKRSATPPAFLPLTSNGHPQRPVSVAAEPWVIEQDDRSETAPTGRTIRRPVQRRVLSIEARINIIREIWKEVVA